MRRDLDRLAQGEFDVLVVGGGITGVAVAREAARRGLEAALLERGDFGGATSGNSQRMIHGGVRYLQQADIGRLRRSVKERRAVTRLAPHLIEPVPILVPTYGRGVKGKLFLRCGMWAYELLSLDRNAGLEPDRRIPGHGVLSRRACLEAAPGLKQEGLTGGVVFWDALARNTERLTMEFALSGARAGAQLANYVSVDGFLGDEGRIKGVRARDLLAGRAFEVRARVVLNAAGPWASRLAGRKAPLVRAMALLTRSVTDRYALAITSGDTDPEARIRRGARAYFITPWRGCSLIGTAERPFLGDPDSYEVTRDEVMEFVHEVNAALPTARLVEEDVLRVFSGFQPASDEEGSRIAKQDHLEDHAATGGPEGLVSVIGAKYTTAGSLAGRAVAMALRKLGRSAAAAAVEASRAGSGSDELGRLYGGDRERVLAWTERDARAKELLSEQPYLLAAQVIHAVEEEMAVRLADVVLRRTELGMFGPPPPDALERCAAIMAEALSWDQARVEAERAAVDAHYRMPHPMAGG